MHMLHMYIIMLFIFAVAMRFMTKLPFLED